VALLAQTLTWTADNEITRYKTAPTTAVAGETTIVFENSEATGNTTGMPHTLTFDTSTEGYNHDVNLNILANPFDANNGRHTATVTLTPGRYRYFCSIPGHSSMVGEFTVTGGPVDTTPPTVSGSVSGTRDPDGNYVGSATVTVTASDAGGSGVASVEYQLDDTSFVPYTQPVVVTAIGDHSVQYRATDVAGNVSAVGSVQFRVVEPDDEDTTPPMVGATVAGNRDPQGRYVGSATVTVTATDADSGVARIETSVDGAAFQPYTAPVVVSSVGMHMVHYRATDNAGNTSPEGMVSFEVVAADTTPPTVTGSVSGIRDTQGNYIDRASVTVTASDSGSGVASVEYSLDGGAFIRYPAPVVVSTPGPHTVRFHATDNAGNTSPDGSVSFTVVTGDTTPPTISGSVAGDRDANGNYLDSATVTVTASDGGSGVATVQYSVDGAAYTTYTAPVVVSSLGAHTVAFRATDNAGNTSPTGLVNFTVVRRPVPDTTPPVTSATVTGNRDGTGAYIGSATVTVAATDAQSGVRNIEYALDAGPYIAYTAPVVVGTTGPHSVRYRATDNAGNVAAEQTVTFTVVAPGSDACPNSDTRPTVVIDGVDTGVANVDTGNGCTINDLIAENAEYPDHPTFVRHVQSVTAPLVTNGVITRRDQGAIVRAAAASTIGSRSFHAFA
jgi:plastocyanin